MPEQKLIQDASVGQILDVLSINNDVDPLLCKSTAYVECRFNYKEYGDNGTSAGMFQLHEGGELPSDMTLEQALNPIANSAIAIQHIAVVAHENPTWSPGEIAAAAQRPADPTAYATLVNQVYDAAKAGQFPIGWLEGISVKTGLSIPEPPSLIPNPVNNQPPQVDVGPHTPVVDPDSPPAPEPGPEIPANYSVPTIGEGSTGTWVRTAQYLLESVHNISVGAAGIDGKFGPATAEAVAVFQARNNLTIDKIIGPATWQKLFA